MNKTPTLEQIISLAKRRGFIFQGSDIYGGLAGTWDYGPLGVALKNNLTSLWWKFFVESRDDMYGVNAAILMNPKTWQASGHTKTFADPLVECKNCHSRFRADKLLDQAKKKHPETTNEQDDGSLETYNANMKSLRPSCPVCKKTDWTEVRAFNMMFETHAGPVADESSIVYLRPETAQGIFTNYKNIVDTIYPDLPFGIAQIGKAFRNEISPRDFIFRSREFGQMEIEYFIKPDNWQQEFDRLLDITQEFLSQINLSKSKLHLLEVPEKDRAHYSKRTIDIEYDFPIGREELLGIAYRTDFDLRNIERESKKSMEYIDKQTGERLVPHVIEPSFGIERLIMAILSDAFTEENGRIYLNFTKELAPIKAVVSPLLKNKPELVKKARTVYEMLKKELDSVMWDDSGNIGKRYAKADEIGVPSCVVVDFDTLEDDTVTVRDRNTTNQTRVKITDLLKNT